MKENKAQILSEENKLLVKDSFITSAIGAAIESNSKLTIDNLISMGILSRVPLAGKFKDAIIDRKLVKMYLDEQIAN